MCVAVNQPDIAHIGFSCFNVLSAGRTGEFQLPIIIKMGQNVYRGCEQIFP